MKISFGMLFNNETDEMHNLLKIIARNVDYDYEIVIVEDEGKCENKKSREMLSIWEKSSHISLYSHPLNDNFGEAKNYLNSKCDGDVIFNLDPDEYPHVFLVKHLNLILNSNPKIDAYWIPRINTVDGITNEHIQKWNWRVNEKGWINFPDFQLRVYRNSSDIKWVNHWTKNDRGCHESIEGFKQVTHLPSEEQFCIYHPKTIIRQEQQNEYYQKIVGN